MNRTAIIGSLLLVLILATAVVVAQDPGGDRRPDTSDRNGEHARGPSDPPGPGGPHGPGGPRRPDGPPPGHSYEERLAAAEQEYAEELREAREQIAEQRRTLEENVRRLREIWEKRGQQLSPEETEKLRAEFKRLVDEGTEIELSIAERQVELAQKGLDIAIERIVQAKVELHEAQIKQRRRERWFRGEWGRHMRGAREERGDRGDRDQPPRDPQDRPNGDAQPPDEADAEVRDTE